MCFWFLTNTIIKNNYQNSNQTWTKWENNMVYFVGDTPSEMYIGLVVCVLNPKNYQLTILRELSLMFLGLYISPKL